MSATASPETGKVYGVERVCAAGDVARSTFYDRRDGTTGAPLPRKKRGPKTKISDEDLLARIREDLAASPFRSEGHRKVWARLRRKEVRVGRKRVLRLMRENRLLSPHRAPQAPPKSHTGKITTDAPNVMWGTDGARVLTVDDGWGWVFVAAEHWNTECMGHHVCKVGDRFAALEPVAMGVEQEFGSLAADAARGLTARMDNGPQYTADHFRKQLRFWGIAPSFAFVGEPQTNGVAERFIETLRHEVLDGRVFRNLEEVRQAVASFVRIYNEHWLLEKLGYLSPKEARERWEREKAA
jgi:transposase InsO family protein